ncbi:MAG: GNAT family N-acetyltransferase [Erysipelotrichaceae bacterium]|nr:GNAT family N-acetyltransferase [Erysipelotrichaceae bacterium]
MLELWPYQKEDAGVVISWISDEKSFYQWSAGKFGEFPLTENRFNQEIFNGVYHPFVVVEDDELVGFFVLRQPEPKSYRFGFIVVDEAHRGKGYGKKVLALGLNKCKELKAKNISLGVFDNNPCAYHCYEKVGFRKIGAIKQKINDSIWNCIEMEFTGN